MLIETKIVVVSDDEVIDVLEENTSEFDSKPVKDIVNAAAKALHSQMPTLNLVDAELMLSTEDDGEYYGHLLIAVTSRKEAHIH